MYRILGGKRYDTTKAVSIVEVTYSTNETDMDEYGEIVTIHEDRREGLYRTAAGTLFVAMQASGDDGEATTIIPVSKYEALQWAEDRQHRFDIESVIEALGGAEALGIVDA